VYSRTLDGKSYNFEPSGGLIRGGLVMQDRETDTYWEMMSNRAIAGKLSGKTLVELPIGSKMPWKDWVKRYPKTLVLSVYGAEDRPGDPYANYFKAKKGYRGLVAKDKRLPTKESIYALQLGKRKIAVPHRSLVGGGVFVLGDGDALFLHRPKGASMFRSTASFRTSGKIELKGSTYVHVPSGARFDGPSETWKGARPGTQAPQRVAGFDTFWFGWSLTHPDTEVLGLGAKGKGVRRTWY
jgi:hypothetical protein